MINGIKIVLLMLFACFECGAEDTVNQPKGDVFASEGKSVTLGCDYSTSDTTPDIFWYIQYPHGVPKLILRQDIYETGVPEDDFKDRFQAKINQTLSSVPLKIQKMQLSDSAVYYCALRPAGAGEKLLFGEGTRLLIQTNVASDPVYYKLEAEDKSVSACLASDFSNYSAANEEPFKNIKPTRIQGESLFSKVVAWTTGDDKCQSFVKEGGDTGRCDSDAYFETDEKVNFLSLTVLGLRILFLKSIVFNVLMTLRAWMS